MKKPKFVQKHLIHRVICSSLISLYLCPLLCQRTASCCDWYHIRCSRLMSARCCCCYCWSILLVLFLMFSLLLPLLLLLLLLLRLLPCLMLAPCYCYCWSLLLLFMGTSPVLQFAALISVACVAATTWPCASTRVYPDRVAPFLSHSLLFCSPGLVLPLSRLSF